MSMSVRVRERCDARESGRLVETGHFVGVPVAKRVLAY